MEKGAGSPEEDDRNVAEVGSKNLLVKILFCHAIMGLKIMGCCYPIPNAPSGGVLGKILAKFRKFSCHSFFGNSPL